MDISKNILHQSVLWKHFNIDSKETKSQIFNSYFAVEFLLIKGEVKLNLAFQIIKTNPGPILSFRIKKSEKLFKVLTQIMLVDTI